MAQEETKTDYMTVFCGLVAFALITYLCLLALFMFYPPAYKTMVGNPMILYEKFRKDYILYNDPYREILWSEIENAPQGVTVNDADKTYKGVTLYISAHRDGAQLIDMEGNILHRWGMPYTQACPDQAENNVPEHMYFWGRAHMDKDGSLLALIDCYGAAYMLKLDKDSNELWRYSKTPHHDMAQAQNSDIYVLSSEARNEDNENMPYIHDPYVDEFVSRLDADGNELARISIYDAFVGSVAEHMLKQVVHDPTGGILNPGDMLHPNSIEIITEDIAGISPFLIEGHLLLSFRNNSLLAILDPETKKITHAVYGGWRAQHDPRFWTDGTVIMFDNEGWLGAGGASRVIQFDLTDGFILWQYTGTEGKPLYSPFNSSVDPLPNGNILITESAGGRLLEVNASGEIVWEFINPERAEQDGKALLPAIFRGRRYNADNLTFLEGR